MCSTREAILAAAEAMVPRLRERQRECEALGRLPDATQAEFVEAGFYRILQPRRFDGCELDLQTFYDVMALVARGCPSSGWVLALTAGHAHTVAALFPEATQAEVFSKDFRAPFSANGHAVCTPCDGGYRLSGVWNYVSGCDFATHYIGLATLAGSDARVFAMVPRADFRIVQDWDVLGMRGTGSHRVVVEDVFVPTGYVVPQALDLHGSRSAPGRHVHPNPLYAAGRIGAALWGEMAAVAVGIAQGALDAYETELRGKKLSYPPFLTRSEVPEFQRHYARAWALIASAEAGLARVAADYTSFCAAEAQCDDVFTDERDAGLRLLEQQITFQAADAVDLMFRTAGTSATRSNSPLQRLFRDMSMLRTHHAAQADRGAEEFGRAHLMGDSPRAL
ncbi:MAG: oxidoreductase [Chloroflexi bacterium]|nr:oxidoreductase [Chloroflexota bacterium]